MHTRNPVEPLHEVHGAFECPHVKPALGTPSRSFSGAAGEVREHHGAQLRLLPRTWSLNDDRWIFRNLKSPARGTFTGSYRISVVWLPGFTEMVVTIAHMVHATEEAKQGFHLSRFLHLNRFWWWPLYVLVELDESGHLLAKLVWTPALHDIEAII